MFSKGGKEMAVNDKLETLIGKDASVQGTVKSKGTLRIDGELEGEIASEADVVIGETGKVHAGIHARNVLVSGNVVGNIMAQGKIEIEPSGKIQGDLKATKLIVDEGAIFDGKCTMDEGIEIVEGVQENGKNGKKEAGAKA